MCKLILSHLQYFILSYIYLSCSRLNFWETFSDELELSDGKTLMFHVVFHPHPGATVMGLSSAWQQTF